MSSYIWPGAAGLSVAGEAVAVFAQLAPRRPERLAWFTPAAELLTFLFFCLVLFFFGCLVRFELFVECLSLSDGGSKCIS